MVKRAVLTMLLVLLALTLAGEAVRAMRTWLCG